MLTSIFYYTFTTETNNNLPKVGCNHKQTEIMNNELTVLQTINLFLETRRILKGVSMEDLYLACNKSKLVMVKLIKERDNLGLKEAKDKVDIYFTELENRKLKPIELHTLNLTEVKFY